MAAILDGQFVEKIIFSQNDTSDTLLAVIHSEVLQNCHFYTLPHVSGGVLCFHVGRPCVRTSVRPHLVSVR